MKISVEVRHLEEATKPGIEINLNRDHFEETISNLKEVAINGVTYVRKYKFSFNEIAFLGNYAVATKAMLHLPIGTLFCYADKPDVLTHLGGMLIETVGTKADIEGYNG